MCDEVLSARPGKRVHGRAAFTLIELLVVILIISVLAGLLFTALSSAQQSARSAQCINNLKELAAANTLYAADHNGVMANDPTSSDGSNNTLYPQLLWPYVKPNMPYPGYTGVNEPAIFVGTIFHCPQLVNDKTTAAKSTPPVTFANYRSYGMNYYMADNPADSEASRPKRMTNVPHLSSTMLFCDNFNNTVATPTNLAGRHSGKCNVVYCDGHAATVTITAAMRVSTKTDPFWGDLKYNQNQ